MSLKLNFFPCFKARMGDWNYYVTRMRMDDVIHEVQFASEFGAQENQVDVLSHARQRALSTGRVTDQIVKFLGQDFRFFSSLVVATTDGSPKFFPVKVSGNDVVNVFEDSDDDETFGFLRLDQNRKMYALDGQHRLSAINCMLDENYRKKLGIEGGQEKIKIPAGFKNEHISVILVVHSKSETRDEFSAKYRRLFSSLNRYAKKTDEVTNIIMDEDDVYAILTRRLISEHPFFKDKTQPKESESTRVKMKAGDNLSPKEPQFITLKILYHANKCLLNTAERMKQTRPDEQENPWDLQIRPEPEELESLYKELSNYWDAIVGALPDLKKSPKDMRPSHGDGHLFFRPIGQQCLMPLVRKILDKKPALKGLKVSDMQKRIRVLAAFSWDIQRPPWDGIVTRERIVKGKKGTKMRNEDRDKVKSLVQDMVLCMIGDEYMLQEVDDDLRERWEGLIEDTSDKKKKWKKDVRPLLVKEGKKKK